MIDRKALLADLQGLLRRLEADLLERSDSDEVPEVGEALRTEFVRAQQAQRTAQNFEDWRADAITQAAAAWVLSCVFVRFLEDNRLIEPPRIAGPVDRLVRARDEHELYFRAHPTETDRHYLLAGFDELAKLPGAKDIFGEHNPIRELPNWLSGDAAGELLRFFQKIDANTGALVHDFTDPDWDTRFLGDLYQDLSEAARKKYALLQTPEFVEEFILDRTLDPAIKEFGLAGFRMVDPACGSGHFLLGSFRRILNRWQKQEPGTKVRDLVQKALDSIHGVDLNPYAMAIARFRLLLAAMRASNIRRLADSPAFQLTIVCGDSLLHGVGAQASLGWHELDHAYQAEDHAELIRILKPGHYHAVVANPPYITPKDRALNDAYRERYSTCHGKYSLAVPFMQRLFQLGVNGYRDEQQRGGFVGQITSNSFMKREFGKKLIEEYIAGRGDNNSGVDLTHVIDTSGAYIPGHGTPTVILIGRNRKPMASTIRTVMGIRGEPSTPDNPALGLVWSAIVSQIDLPDSQSEFVSVSDSPRDNFHKHPWSIGGGGAAELKEQIEDHVELQLSEIADVGVAVVTLEDEAFQIDRATARRSAISSTFIKGFVVGDAVRDWQLVGFALAIFPHDDHSFQPIHDIRILRHLWPLKTALVNRLWFRKTMSQRGMEWFAYGHISIEKFRTPLSIAYGEVATHNHFVLDRGGMVFNRTSPVIKLPAAASEDDHVALLGLLNSSVACFWLKQVCHNKGSTVDQNNARQRTAPFEDFFAFNATKLQQFPLPGERPLALARQLDHLAQQLAQNTSDAAIAAWQAQLGPELVKERSLRQCLDDAYVVTTLIQGEMLLVQEDLDWECYRLYGLLDEELTVRLAPDEEDRCVPPGNRAFEIVMARKMATDELQSTWFQRHGITPTVDLPDPAYNQKYREMVARRIEVIESNPEIALIEQPEYKRRWNWEPWESQKERALRHWLLNRLEAYLDFDGRMNERGEPTAEVDVGLISVARLADIADPDSEFHHVGAALQGDLAFDIPRLVTELVEAESVPLLPILRYKPSGLRKRAEWEATWELQRREGAGETVGKIAVPPKYTSADFLKSDYWRLRGKLDVPKERWVSFPHCEGPDGTLVIAWAGYDHLQLATAIGQYYQRVKDEFGGSDDPRLVPLLACLIEMLTWLKQWHNEVSPEFGVPMGEYFEGFVQEEARQLGKTLPEIQSWQPPARTGGRRRQRT